MDNVMTIRNALDRIWRFNQTDRDRWVTARSREIAPGLRILDVGAGACLYRPLFSHCEYRSHDFTQLDPAQLPSGYGRIDYVSDVTQIPVPDASFDVVLCTEVLEHVPNPIAAIREMARIVRDGGRILLTTPLGASIHQQPYHYYGGYTPFWFQKVLAEAGFREIAVEPNGGFFKHYGQESIRFAQLTVPWRIAPNRLLAVLSFPVWLPIALWFALICPLLCHVLDGLDRTGFHTIGYHVTAVRRRSAGAIRES